MCAVSISVLHCICDKRTPLENRVSKAKVLLTLHKYPTSIQLSYYNYITVYRSFRLYTYIYFLHVYIPN